MTVPHTNQAAKQATAFIATKVAIHRTTSNDERSTIDRTSTNGVPRFTACAVVTSLLLLRRCDVTVFCFPNLRIFISIYFSFLISISYFSTNLYTDIQNEQMSTVYWNGMENGESTARWARRVVWNSASVCVTDSQPVHTRQC